MKKDWSALLNRHAGALSFFGTYLALVVLAISSGLLPQVGLEILGLFFRLFEGLSGFRPAPVPFLDGLRRVPVALALLLPVGFVVGRFTRWRFLVAEDVEYDGFARPQALNRGSVESMPQIALCLTLFEEIGARWLLLGVVRSLPLFAHPYAFLFLTVVGIAATAAFRRDLAKRIDLPKGSWLTLIVPALLSTYLYVRAGFWVALAVRLAYDAILPGTWHKIQPLTRTRWHLVRYGALCACAAYLFLDHPLADLRPWFTQGQPFALPGWGFGSYLLLAILIDFGSVLFFDALLYDLRPVEDEKLKKQGTRMLFYTIVANVLMPLVLYGGARLVGLFTTSTLLPLILTTVLSAFGMQTARSTSATVRGLLCHVPTMYLMTALLLAIGPWQGIVICLICVALNVPRYLLIEGEAKPTPEPRPAPLPGHDRPTATA